MQVFMVQGSVIGVLGTLLGVVGGVILALNVEPVVGWIEKTFGVSFMDKNVYLIPYLPSEVQASTTSRAASLIPQRFGGIHLRCAPARVQRGEERERERDQRDRGHVVRLHFRGQVRNEIHVLVHEAHAEGLLDPARSEE